MNEEEANRKAALMHRAQMSTQDMWDAINFSTEHDAFDWPPGGEEFAKLVQAKKEHVETMRMRAAIVAAVVAYARPFMKSEGGGVAARRILCEQLKDIHPHHRDLHARLIRIRHDIIAHAVYEPRQTKQDPDFKRTAGGKEEWGFTGLNYWEELDKLTLREIHDHAQYMLHPIGKLAGELSDELIAAGFPP